MKKFNDLAENELKAIQEKLQVAYGTLKNKALHLDMTRGKPAPEQLDMVQKHFENAALTNWQSEAGLDCRNYGSLTGLIELKRLFAELLEAKDPESIFVLGNSSLNVEYSILLHALISKLPGANKPWRDEEKIKMICPVPGYDRHFSIADHLGFEMIPVAFSEAGLDIEKIMSLVAQDPAIKAMFLIPLYNNPGGQVLSQTDCEKLANMPTAAKDFRIIVDNAYGVHHLFFEEQLAKIPNFVDLAATTSYPDRFFLFTSTSKITYAGAGISCVASSPANLKWYEEHLAMQNIGPDKMNQLQHFAVLKNKENILNIMRQHADILRPKFLKVEEILAKELAGTGLCSWSKPRGGYFVSVDVYPDTAKDVVELCKQCGVLLTAAGNTYPYKQDPDNKNLRLAPSYPNIEDIEMAMEIFCICVKLAALKKLIK